MSQDVGIAGTAKGIVDAAVAQVDICVTADISLITATIDILGLGQLIIRPFR